MGQLKDALHPRPLAHGSSEAVYKAILMGHKVAKGRAQGEALVSRHPIAFQGGVDAESGIITDKNNDLVGTSVADKILVFPVGKGSSVGGYRLYEMKRCHTAPKGIINLRADPVVAVGAIFAEIPMVDRLDGDPLDLIETGDEVEIDADHGVVRIKVRGGVP